MLFGGVFAPSLIGSPRWLGSGTFSRRIGGTSGARTRSPAAARYDSSLLIMPPHVAPSAPLERYTQDVLVEHVMQFLEQIRTVVGREFHGRAIDVGSDAKTPEQNVAFLDSPR